MAERPSIASIAPWQVIEDCGFGELRDAVLPTLQDYGPDEDAAKRQLGWWLLSEFGESGMACQMSDELAAAGRHDEALTWLWAGVGYGNSEAKAYLALALFRDAATAAERIEAAAWWCAAMAEAPACAADLRPVFEDGLSTSELIEASALSVRLRNRVN